MYCIRRKMRLKHMSTPVQQLQQLPLQMKPRLEQQPMSLYQQTWQQKLRTVRMQTQPLPQI